MVVSLHRLQALESARPVVEKRCGSFDALKKSVENPTASFGQRATARVKAVIQACKITGVPDKDIPTLDPWAVLASAVVGDELGAGGQSSDDERKVAAALVYICTPMQRPKSTRADRSIVVSMEVATMTTWSHPAERGGPSGLGS
jgi:hypothetical protein